VSPTPFTFFFSFLSFFRTSSHATKVLCYLSENICDMVLVIRAGVEDVVSDVLAVEARDKRNRGTDA
jgi:hypothetical protein